MITQIDPEIIAAIIGAILGVVLGAFFTYLLTLRSERQKKSELSYKKIINNPLIFTNYQLAEDLRIYYQDIEIHKLTMFTLIITNSGKKNIKGQIFSCIFSDTSCKINTNYPTISIYPEREVGPINFEEIANNEYRFNIGIFGPGQICRIDFVMVENDSEKFEVIFRPNETYDVIFRELKTDVDLEKSHLMDNLLKSKTSRKSINEILVSTGLSDKEIDETIDRLIRNLTSN